MGIFDDVFANYTGLPQGIMPPGFGAKQGNFVGATKLDDLLQSIIAGATRGIGASAFGGNTGYDASQPYSPQALPQSPADLALGMNRPAYAPNLPSPINIAAPAMGGNGIPQDAAPQVQLPQGATTAAFQGQQQLAPQAAPQAPQPGMFDRVAAGFDNLANAPSLIGGFARLGQGLSTGQRIDDKMQILQDFMGNQVPHWVNPNTRTIQEAQITPAAGGIAPGGLGVPTAVLQDAIRMPTQINPQTGRDDKFIEALGPTVGAAVTSALNGDSKLDGRMLQKLQYLAARAEPGWTQQTYQQRLGAYKSFYGGGKDQETARALNQSMGHFAELVDKMQALPGSQMPILNWAANTVNTQVRGKGEANNFLVNAHAVAAELSRLFKQVNMSDTEIKKWEEGLSPNMSAEQQRGMARTLNGLYQEAFDALEKKRVDGLGPALAAKAPPLIGQHTYGNMKKVEQFGIGQQSPQSGGLPPGWGVRVVK